MSALTSFGSMGRLAATLYNGVGAAELPDSALRSVRVVPWGEGRGKTGAVSLGNRVVASASYRGLSRLLYIIVEEMRPTLVELGRCEDTGGYGRGQGASCQVQPTSEGNLKVADFRARKAGYF